MQDASVAGVCEQACGALWNMTCNANNQVSAGTAGGVEEVVKVLRNHVGVAGVCEQACGALCNMTYYNNAYYQVLAGTAGGVEEVVKVLRNHARLGGVC